MEVAEDFPQKSCKFKSRNEWQNGRRTKQIEEHRKKRKNKDSVDEPLDLNHVKFDKTIVLKDLRVMVDDDAEHPPFQKFFYVFAKNKIEADEPCGALDPNRNQAGKSAKNKIEVDEPCCALDPNGKSDVGEDVTKGEEPSISQINCLDENNEIENGQQPAPEESFVESIKQSEELPCVGEETSEKQQDCIGLLPHTVLKKSQSLKNKVKVNYTSVVNGYINGFVRAEPNCKIKEELEPTSSFLNKPTCEYQQNIFPERIRQSLKEKVGSNKNKVKMNHISALIKGPTHMPGNNKNEVDVVQNSITDKDLNKKPQCNKNKPETPESSSAEKYLFKKKNKHKGDSAGDLNSLKASSYMIRDCTVQLEDCMKIPERQNHSSESEKHEENFLKTATPPTNICSLNENNKHKGDSAGDLNSLKASSHMIRDCIVQLEDCMKIPERQNHSSVIDKKFLEGKSKAELEEMFVYSARETTSRPSLNDLTEGSDAQPFFDDPKEVLENENHEIVQELLPSISPFKVPENHEVAPEPSTSISQSLKVDGFEECLSSFLAQ